MTLVFPAIAATELFLWVMGDGYKIHVRNDFDKRGSHLLHRHLHLSFPAQARAMLRSVAPTLEAGPLSAQQNA